MAIGAVGATSASGRHAGIQLTSRSSRGCGYPQSVLKPVNLGRRWRPHSWSTEPFKARSWPDLRDRFWGLADLHPEQLAAVEIIDSVVNCAADRLTGNYTIGGLHVADAAHRDPPYSVITIELYGRGAGGVPAVAVWHVSTSGLREEIVKPIDSAVPLFWRFVFEKFGLT
jgi:hypothetical protein